MADELTDAEKQALLEAYLKDKSKRDQLEKRKRQGMIDNSDEAIRRRIDWDPHDI